MHLSEEVKSNVEELYKSQKSGRLVFEYLSGLYFTEMKNLLLREKTVHYDPKLKEGYFEEKGLRFDLTLMKSATHLFNNRLGVQTKKSLGKKHVATNIFQPTFWISIKGAHNKLGIYSGMPKCRLDDYVNQAIYLTKYKSEIEEKLQSNFFDLVSISSMDWNFIPSVRSTINTQILGTDYIFTFKNKLDFKPNPKLFNIKRGIAKRASGTPYKYDIQKLNTKDLNEVIEFLKNDPEYTSQRLKYKLNDSITKTIMHSGIF